MKIRASLLASAAAVVVASALACEPEMSLESALSGRRCRDEGELPRCLDGYECSPAGLCVRPGSLGSGGGGSGGAGAGGDSEGGQGGAVSLGGSGANAGATSEAGAPGAGGGAGAGGDEGDPDASVPPVDGGTGGSGGCEQPLFLDRDGDGYGSDAPEDAIVGCPTPGYATVAGDCNDALPGQYDLADDVHPGQQGYFYVGYPAPGAPRDISFDYDCSGNEDADPTNDPSEAAPACGGLGIACSGTGFRPEDRSGPGIDSLCGSEIVVTCQQSGLACTSEEIVTSNLYRCR